LRDLGKRLNLGKLVFARTFDQALHRQRRPVQVHSWISDVIEVVRKAFEGDDIAIGKSLRQPRAAEELSRGPVAQVKPLVQKKLAKLRHRKRPQRQHRNQLQQFAAIHALAFGRSDTAHFFARWTDSTQHSRGSDFFWLCGGVWLYGGLGNALVGLGSAVVGRRQSLVRRLLFPLNVVGDNLSQYEEAC